MIQNRQDFIFLLISYLLAIAVFYPSLHVPFLFSEVPGILKNPVVQDIQNFFDRMLSLRGLFDKPISLLTFTLNYRVSNGPFGFHLINLFIHFCNAYLVFKLAGLAKIEARISFAFFLFNPISTAVVSQIFGRPYSLGLFFLLLGLYLTKRESPERPLNYIRLTALTIVLFLTKQSFIAAPLLFLKRVRPSWRPWFLAFVSLIGLCSIVLYALPYSLTAPVSFSVYAISQVDSFLSILGLLLLPFQTALIHELKFISTIWHTTFLAGLSLLGTLFIFSLKSNRFQEFLRMFLILYVPTHLLAKNEIIREWRLYPSVFALSMLIGCMFKDLPLNKLKHVAGLTVIMLYMFTIWNQGKVYQSPERAWKQVIEKYPYSSTAWNNIGIEYVKRSELINAENSFKKAIQFGPHTSVYQRNLASVLTVQGQEKEAMDLVNYSLELESKYGKNEPATHFKD